MKELTLDQLANQTANDILKKRDMLQEKVNNGTASKKEKKDLKELLEFLDMLNEL